MDSTEGIIVNIDIGHKRKQSGFTLVEIAIVLDPIAANAVFVSRGKSNNPGAEFDDVVSWLSSNALYHGLVAAGRPV